MSQKVGDKGGKIKEVQEAEENQEQEEEQQRVLPPDFFYEDNVQEKEIYNSPISQEVVDFHVTLGFDSMKKYNLNLLDSDTIIYISGKTYITYNYTTKQRKIYFAREKGGLGSIAVHPSKQYFAVGEKGNFPNIYIYEYPSMKLYRILRKGAEKSFSNLNFSKSGDRLASVAGYPDYLLCVWNWTQETIILKAKAFSQEVYRVTFSEHQDTILTTAGMGHIRFWKIAKTFTGLKLKGDIGKFGQVELSDITAYYEFSDGKVISGTEYGRLLLWEGNFIKAVISINEEKACHDGSIEYIGVEDNQLITAGSDGYIKYWNQALIEDCEGDDFLNFYLEPQKEICVIPQDGKKSKIIGLTRGDGFLLINDANGKILKLTYPDNDIEIIQEQNSGKLMDLAASQRVNAVVSAGEDGAVRLWDFVHKREFYSRFFSGKGTCLEWVPESRSNKARVIMCGFSNGIVRILALEKENFVLLKAVKVHKSGINKIKISPDSTKVAITSESREVFFLELNPSNPQLMDPYCLYELESQINDIVWDGMSQKVLLGLNNGLAVEIKVPKRDECDNQQTYIKTPMQKKYLIRMMEYQKPKLDEYQEFLLARKNPNMDFRELLNVEWEPAPILSCAYYDNECSRILLSVDNNFLGCLYVCDFQQERPILTIDLQTKVPTRRISVNTSGLLMCLHDDGSYTIRHLNSDNKFLRINPHDPDYGKVKNAVFNYDKSVVLSASEDGTIFSYLVDWDIYADAQRGRPLIKKSNTKQPQDGLELNYFDEKVTVSGNKEEDILNENIYSLQEDKLLTEEDNKKMQAEAKKKKVLEQIQNLQLSFQQIKEKNGQLDEFIRLNDEELNIDPDYVKMLEQQVQEQLEETRKELAWDQAYYEQLHRKLRDLMISELEVDRFMVKSFKTNAFVTTFKVKRLSEYIRVNLEEITRIIAEEARNSPQYGQENENENNRQSPLDSSADEIRTGTYGPNRGRRTSLTQEENGNTNKWRNNNILNSTSADNRDKQQQQQQQQQQIKYDREHFKREEERRRREIEELEKQRPNEDAFEGEFAKKLNKEIETRGDFKLKSSDNYIVPENQRMNVNKKRKHMFLLEEFLYKTKMGFNQDVINLREKKQQIIQKIEKYNQEIIYINNELGIKEELFWPKLDIERETPEREFEVTEEQIDEYYKQKMQKDKKVSMLDALQQDINNKTIISNDNKKEQQTNSNVQKGRKGQKIQVSELEKEEMLVQEILLNSKKKKLMDEISNEIQEFDRAVAKSQKEKYIVESDMKIANMKLVLYYQELLILNDMEEKDNQLIQKLFDFRKDKHKLEEQSSDIVRRILDSTNEEIQIQKELNEVIKKFDEAIFSEDDAKRKKIYEYFKNKHNAKKQKEMQREEDDNEDPADDNISEVDDFDDDFDDDLDPEEREEFKSLENDKKIKAIKEARLKCEDQIADLQKQRNDLDKQKNQISNKISVVDNHLKNTEKELRDYQLKKLKKVNKLDVSACLQISQIQNLIKMGDKYVMPDDLNESILFTRADLVRIGYRASELENDKKKYIEKFDKLRKKKAKRDKQIDKLRNNLAEHKRKYVEEHMLKFGGVIDLKILDSLQPTKEQIESKDRYQQEEKESALKVEEAKQSLIQTKKKLVALKKENTRIINHITNLGNTQMKLNKNLDSTNKNLFKEEKEDKREALGKDRKNLNELVKFLSKEIEDLKTEIGYFKRKGGHIYSMATTTKKNTSDNQ